jgi:VanZ family protein
MLQHSQTGFRSWLWVWGPVVFWMALIFFISSLHEAPLPPGISDKSGHGLGYVGMSVLLVRAMTGGLPRPVSARVAAITIVVTMLYGMSDEIHQLFVAGRSSDVNDFAADSVGACIGTAACWAWGIISTRWRARGSFRHEL